MAYPDKYFISALAKNRVEAFVKTDDSARRLIDFSFQLNYFSSMQKPAFHYIYILQSTIDTDRFYIGFTENIENRLKDHNSGKNPHTARYKPWRIKTAIAFTHRQKALDFERYLKTKSGRAFAKKRL
jgi:predicted GIY-YIG superfamily endonuclease